MQIRKTWLILLLVSLMALWGCSDDDDNGGPTTPTVTAFEHLAEIAGAVINDNSVTPRVIGVDAVYTAVIEEDPPLYTVIDIRSQADYDAGHIPGAYHSTLGTLLDDLDNDIPSDKPYLLVCYSGQSVGHAKFAMELLGYEVYSMGFGMSAWNSTLSGPWNNNINNLLVDAETENQNDNLIEHDFPELTESVGTVLEARIATMLAGGFKGAGYASISGDLDNYFIINYHSLADYLGENSANSGIPGHIPGAYQFTPFQTLGIEQMLNNLPTDMPIIVYCWTGQHSSQVVAYLNMLGYDAYSLTFGVNSLFHDELLQNKWDPDTSPRSYPLEETTD